MVQQHSYAQRILSACVLIQYPYSSYAASTNNSDCDFTVKIFYNTIPLAIGTPLERNKSL